MRKTFFLFLILSFILIYSCDDDGVITFELDFEKTYKACEGVSDLVFYKTKEDPSESLSILINDYSLDDILEVGDDNTFSETKSATLYYRTYSDTTLSTDLFCNDVPTNVTINLDEEDDVDVEIITTLVEDDDDGIPAELEYPENNPNLEGKDDFDGDGLDNYIDADDDGDNVLTADENPDPNGDGDLSDAQDTDGDGIPDYLDIDDDNDGVDTRDEENTSQNQGIPDYLNPDAAETVLATAYIPHTIIQTYVVALNVTSISLSMLSQDKLDFGFLEHSSLSDSRTVTPEF